ncbi:uncharacterized protein LOC105444458 [Strongylocentrotus purpuratus]|uniref:Peptidase S9A N-terminal domain-containing protein n=1 Tax=Strongylocentrotus purpuratus TaxID=7668 RepID=A0A7M7PQW5_STRPU|nr:uncharacterized protein LOC105444458 [Strongylocentrotus purpuratus]
MELWKMIIHPLLRVRVRNRSTWNAISKVLHTTPDASIYNSDISNYICHPSRSHHRFQKRHHPPETNSSQFPSSKGETAKPRAYQFTGWRIWRKNTTDLPFKTVYSTTSSSNFTSDSSSRMPAAAKNPTKKTVFGHQWVDEYAWMQQGFSEELLQYIKAENNFSEQYFNHLKAMQEKLRADIIQCEEGDYGSETNLKVIGDYAYYSDISESGSSIFCRRNIRTGEDQVLLDSNHLMELFGYNQVIITGFKISPCQRYLGAVVEGSPDAYDGHIIKMEVGGQCRLVECIQDITNMEFLGEDSVLYTKPFSLQAREVWRHRIGSSQQGDELVFEEMDERFFVDLSHTKDRRYVVINSNSRTSSELWLIDCLRSSSETQPVLVWPRQDGVECYLDSCGQTLLALSNAGDSSELKASEILPSKSTIFSLVSGCVLQRGLITCRKVMKVYI